MEIFAQYGGEMLAVDEAPTVLEGQWPHTRTVLIRIADKVLADAWYRAMLTNSSPVIAGRFLRKML